MKHGHCLSWPSLLLANFLVDAHQVRVAHIPSSGLIALLLTLASATCFAVEVPTMPTVTVHGSRFEETLDAALPQTTIIQGVDIVRSGLTDVSQILQKLGNAPTRINLSGTQDQSIDLRGYGVNSDNNVVVLLDGMRLSEIEQASARLSMIPVEIIDHIEIIRGAASVLYGEGATGGVINIVTKKNTGDITTLAAKVGSFNAHEVNLYASHQFDKAAISFYGKTLDTDNYRQNNAAQVRSGGATLRWNPEAVTSVGVRIYVDEQNTRLPGPLSLTQAQQNPTLTVNPNDYGSTRGSSATLFGSTTYKGIELAADVSVRNKDANSTLPSLGGTTDSFANLVSLSPRAKIHNALLTGNDLSVGVDLSKWDRSYSSIYPAYPAYSVVNEQLTQRSYAIYLRDDWTINPVNRLTLGARLEEIDKSVANFNTYSNPNTHNSLSALEVQYTRTINQVAQAYLRAGQGYRVPNIDDLRGAGSALVPQTSVDYELGLNLQKLSPTNATLRAFRSQVQHEIFYDPVQYTNVNLPTTQREGVELEGRYQAGDTVAFRGSLQRIRALFMEGAYQGRHVPLVPKLNAQAGVQWTPVIHHTIDLSARVVGRQPLDADFTNTLAPIPSYWTTDLRYTSQFTKRLAWIVAANNLLDRRYYDYANSYGGYYPSPGLNVYTSLKLSF